MPVLGAGAGCWCVLVLVLALVLVCRACSCGGQRRPAFAGRGMSIRNFILFEIIISGLKSLHESRLFLRGEASSTLNLTFCC